MAKILIIDDSATSRSIAADLIGDMHEVAEAGSGRAGLARLAAERFDLVLLDLLMPEMGGFEVLAEIAARGLGVPVIIATADIQNSTRARAESLGAAGLINKPFRRESLHAAIGAALAAAARARPWPLEPVLKDSFEELMNIAIGKAADVLNTMLNSHIELSAPSVELVAEEELAQRFARSGSGKLAAIEIRCVGGLEASIELIFTTEDAVRLADCVMGASAGEVLERESMRAGALCEIGNIVINAVLGTISNLLEVELSFTVPSYLEGEAADLVEEISLASRGVILLVRTRFEVENLSINGDIALFLSIGSFDSLSTLLRDRIGTGR